LGRSDKKRERRPLQTEKYRGPLEKSGGKKTAGTPVGRANLRIFNRKLTG
jgi:hypothetical protein